MSQGRRSEPLPKGWARIRERVLRRDAHACQWMKQDGTDERCGEPARHVDHVKPASQGGGDGDENLQALCIYHHGKKTGAEGAAAAAQVPRPTRARDPEKHPGML
jgi:5-methylcytosine-specific restriction endonuclease McrA